MRDRQRIGIVAGLALASLALAGCQPGADGGAVATSRGTAPAVTAKMAPQAEIALPEIENRLAAIYDQVGPSVVNIQVSKDAPQQQELPPGMMPPGLRPFGAPPWQQQPDQPLRGSGSGFVWDSAGHIVTNNHVVSGADKVTVTFSDGTMQTAELVGADPDSDLAVVKIPSPAVNLPVVTLADSAAVKVGHLAVAIGNPFGLEGTMTVGYISALGRLLPLQAQSPNQPGYSIPDVIQTDAPINPGNSGGVLTNSSGQVIGVTTAIISPAGASAGIGFAVPSAIVKQVVPALIEKGSYHHTWLGISGVTLSPEIAKASGLEPGQRGALVGEVLPGSPAAKAGVKGGTGKQEVDGLPILIGGDVVIQIGQQPVTRFDDIVAYLARETEVGQTIPLTVLRGGKQVKLDVTLAARPGENDPPTQMASAETEQGTGPRLGIMGGTLTPPIAEAMGLPPQRSGVLVAAVQQGSPAAKAGLLGSSTLAEINGEPVRIGGDVITALGDQKVTSIEDLQTVLGAQESGAKVQLSVIRDGRARNVPVTLGE